MNSLTQLVEDESYTSVLSNVVDTMILRQLMRRFIEAYYGIDDTRPFEVSGIALGVGKGTLDEAINEAVEVYGQLADETTIKKLNKRKNVIPEGIDYEVISLFDEEEYAATSKIKIKESNKQKLVDLHEKATKQFQSVYGGDLFASSIGDVTTKIENLIVKNDPEMWAKFWVDTSSEKYSFRFEDVPPEALEKQYENSMSQNVQIKIESGKPVVFYGEDLQEQKNKGAYYTDEKFVQYMVRQTIEIEFQNRIAQVKEAIKVNDDNKIIEKLDYLFDMKTADLTAGGGSFLRGAFRQLAEKHDALVGLKIPEKIRMNYPMLQDGNEGILFWEEYILHNMIYGVDIDYKAILISSLSLMLSSLQHRPVGHELPKLIGKTLIHQNSLINSVAYYEREKVYSNYQSDIKKLIELKANNFSEYEIINQRLQLELIRDAQKILNGETQFLHVQALEINLPEVFFNDDGTLKENSGFDCVIGNPPWEVWKPNSDEFYSKFDDSYLSLKTATKKKIRQKELSHKIHSIPDKWQELNERYKYGSIYFRSDSAFKYQNIAIKGMKSGAGINLYKISTERFIQLLKSNGLLSIIVPDNLATDQGTVGLRKLVSEEYTINEFLSFENRQGIFPSVDGRYKFAVMNVKKQNSEKDYIFDAFFYRQTLEDLNNTNVKLKMSIQLIKLFDPDYIGFLELRNEKEMSMIKKALDRFDAFGKHGTISFTTEELNATRQRDDFIPLTDSNRSDLIPIYEGKLMEQFNVFSPKEGIRLKNLIKKKNNGDYQFYRLVYRTVASSTNERSFVSTVIPKNSAVVNNLGVSTRYYGEFDYRVLLMYVSYFNSFVVDFILRRLITTNVNLYYVNKLPVPSPKCSSIKEKLIDISAKLICTTKEFDELAKLCGLEGYQDSITDSRERAVLRAKMDAMIAKEYGLSREELIYLLKTFESANHRDKVIDQSQRVIEEFDRLEEEK